MALHWGVDSNTNCCKKILKKINNVEYSDMYFTKNQIQIWPTHWETKKKINSYMNNTFYISMCKLSLDLKFCGLVYLYICCRIVMATPKQFLPLAFWVIPSERSEVPARSASTPLTWGFTLADRVESVFSLLYSGPRWPSGWERYFLCGRSISKSISKAHSRATTRSRRQGS